MARVFGSALRTAIGGRPITTFIGVYDVFSACLAGRHYDGLFVSGYSFAASYYGLPDVGFVCWTDIVAFVGRLRTLLPEHHILVDMDDGYGDEEIAAHVVTALEQAGASGVILEDQKRPRKCGHVDGKQVLELDEFLIKLRRVLHARRDLVVVARTDAATDAERIRRVKAFAQAGADAVLADGLGTLELLTEMRHQVACPIMFNQIAGGKARPYSLSELRAAGVSLVNYSTPCLFAAEGAIEQEMLRLKRSDGKLQEPRAGQVDLKGCNAVLNGNLSKIHSLRVDAGNLRPVAGAEIPQPGEEVHGSPRQPN